MLFMNYYEIDEAVRRWRNHPTLGPATRTLENLRDCADRNSDGWAYWPKPCRAAKRLQELIQAANRQRYRYDRNYTDPTAADIKAAYRPIKAFLTRENLHDKCEVIEP